jgi:hypothetical protein
MIARQIIFFSLISLTLGIILWRRGNRILGNGKRSEATIIKNVYEPDNEGGGFYYPVIEFFSDKNEKITKQLSIGYSPARTIGKRLSIVYDPNDPNEVVTSPGLFLVFIPRLLVAFGITAIITATLDLLEVISLVSIWGELSSNF